MIYHFLDFVKRNKLAVLFFIVLYIIPFFWLKLGDMDLGGDANRLYFYDPANFLKSTALYDVSREGKGIIEPRYFYFPYVSLILLLKVLFYSPTILIDIFNGTKLAVGFFSVYLILYEFLRQQFTKSNIQNIKVSSVIGGIFYIVSFASFHMAFFWDRALFTHDQIFLNPLMFYLLFKFLLTGKYKFLWAFLFISFIFSTNFSLLGSAPPLFAYYPLAIIFIITYLYFIVHKKIVWKDIVIGIMFFLGIHAFHFLPEIVNMFDFGSTSNSIVFSKHGIENEGVQYFTAVRYYGQAVLNLLLPSDIKSLGFTSIIIPYIVVFGLLTTRKKSFLFIAFFFMITFFLATANITQAGFEVYRRLFYLPGFSMFRNFYTQWMYIFIFFYSLIVGFSCNTLLLRLKHYLKKWVVVFLITILVITGIPLWLGLPVNAQIIRGSNNISTISQMDPEYEKMLSYVRKLPNDGKVMLLPLTDNFRQIIHGKTTGAYEGPSTLLDLTTKYSFPGYQFFGYKNNEHYSQDLTNFSKNNQYDKLLQLFTILNIRYILHNRDPRVYEKGVYSGDYGYMQNFMPKTQAQYSKFLSHVPLKVIYKTGSYILYRFDNSFSNKMAYVPNKVYMSEDIPYTKNLVNAAYVDKKTYNSNILVRKISDHAHVQINTKEVNPTVFSLKIKSSKKNYAVLLVMQTPFHKSWKMTMNDRTTELGKHILVNGYANGWLLSGKDLFDIGNKDLHIFLDQQKYFWYGWVITIISIIIMLGFSIISLSHYGKK